MEKSFIFCQGCNSGFELRFSLAFSLGFPRGTGLAQLLWVFLEFLSLCIFF